MYSNSNDEVTKFLQEHALDMPSLYASYDFDGDRHKDGFPKMFALECRITAAAKRNSFDRDDLIEIAKWGGNDRNIPRIEENERRFKFTLYYQKKPLNWLIEEPESYISVVKARVHGYDATYSSKLLHFAVPSVFGMLDTWLVRTFGMGDRNFSKYKFLQLAATNQKNGWSISTPKKLWPSEYGTWIRILHNIADTLNDKKISCPHPENFIKSGMRVKEFWFPADVEIALFSYAYEGRGERLIQELKGVG